MASFFRKNGAKIAEIITAFLTVMLGAALIISCLLIYSSGDRPFSRESVASYLQRISPVFYLFVITIIFRALIAAGSPAPVNKIKPIRDAKFTLDNLYTKLDSDFLSQESAVVKERLFRKRMHTSLCIILAALCIYPIVYLADPSHFSVANLNEDIRSAAIVICIFTAIALLAACIITGCIHQSIQREIKHIQSSLSGVSKKSIPSDSNQNTPTCSKKMNILRVCLLLLSLCFIVMGIFNLGIDDVLGKAIRICTECIGLG